MIKIIDDIPLVPRHSHTMLDLVIGHVKASDLSQTKIPLRERDDGLVELHLNGKPYAKGELTVSGKTGSIRIIDLY
jgi:hypothetical protein